LKFVYYLPLQRLPADNSRDITVTPGAFRRTHRHINRDFNRKLASRREEA